MKRIFQQGRRLIVWRWLAVLVGLAVADLVEAADPIYINNSSSYYYIGGSTPQPPPALDVTAFDNESVFSISYQSFYLGYPFYETLDTVYYTNNGTMICSSPPQTNGFSGSFSDGFWFDLQTQSSSTPHNMAGTFYNPGTIRCNSIIDGNNYFNFFGYNEFILESLGKCVVNATNIINPGTINAGPSGLISLTSQNADLSLGTIYLETLPSAATFLGFSPNTAQTLANLNASGNAGFGSIWNPSTNLTATYASSPAPNQLTLTNATPYIYIDGQGSTNVVVRAIFLLNNSPTVPSKVYFGDANNVGGGFGTVEWAGIYQDPATCNYSTNYLYLNDVFEAVTQTNLFIYNGVPNNFTFTESSVPLLVGMTNAPPQATNFPAGLFQPNGYINPQYASVSAQFLSTGVATNASQSNPSGALTNLPGKIFITASNDLNMANAQISGENYLSLIAPNQFDGSANAQIFAPYADINLGVTNGVLNLANLIANSVPTPSGTIQAWSGEWFYTNNLGVTYDFRVAIISSQLAPVSQSWIQSLRLHATNSLIINDVMNVFSSLLIDAQHFTIATNGCGNGFTSLSGQLNWYNLTVFGPTQMPNVLWLTNNGTLSSLNNAIFGTTLLPYAAFINNGLVSDAGAAIVTTNFVNSGCITNGPGSFALQCQTAVMTNGSLYATANTISLAASSLLVSNEVIQSGRSLTIAVSNSLTDGGFTSNFWTVGSVANTGDGLVLSVKPTTGDLLGTTITNFNPANKNVVDLWAGQDRGYSPAGFSNNVAIGHLVFDSLGSPAGRFTLNGASVSNAIYVDEIEFKDNATNALNNNMTLFNFNTNLVIYYAQAILNGQTFAYKLNGYNTNHFRWVPTYAGYFSSTNIVYPDGTTNTFNAALAQNNQIDSDGDGIPNGLDPTPFFVSSQINLKVTLTNAPARSARLTWMTIPSATNTVLFTTNLLSSSWTVLTNFVSPQPVPSPATNVFTLDLVKTNAAKFYRVSVNALPWTNYPALPN